MSFISGHNLEKKEKFTSHYLPFFYPLDSVYNWNRIYGKRGFLQFQCVLPPENKNKILENILKKVVATGKASFLAVLKEFGEIKSPGMLSFPRPGVTLCLDFACDQKSIELVHSLEQQVLDAGGAIYPAKDALMSKIAFNKFFPKFEEFKKYIDPKFSSSFYRRVT